MKIQMHKRMSKLSMKVKRQDVIDEMAAYKLRCRVYAERYKICGSLSLMTIQSETTLRLFKTTILN